LRQGDLQILKNSCDGISMNCCQGMSKEASSGRTSCPVKAGGYDCAARAAIAAADKWDAEQAKGRTAISGNSQSLGISSGAIGSFQPQPALNQDAMDAETARRGIKSSLALSPGLDSAIQDELDHPPASIMEEGK
jgi:hypothetical protein